MRSINNTIQFTFVNFVIKIYLGLTSVSRGIICYGKLEYIDGFVSCCIGRANAMQNKISAIFLDRGI